MSTQLSQLSLDQENAQTNKTGEKDDHNSIRRRKALGDISNAKLFAQDAKDISSRKSSPVITTHHNQKQKRLKFPVLC